MRLIDTHTHIYVEEFDGDRVDVIARAQAEGVVRMMCPAIDSETHERLFDMCREYPDLCLPMIGVHPTSVNDNPDYMDELRLVEEYLVKPPVDRYYAIGEVGLDLYWSGDWLKEQEEVFSRQIDLALQYGLPLVVHTRKAWAETIAILERYKGKGLRGVMHAYSGTVDDYRRIKSCGDFVFGVGGVLTYKNSTLVDIVAAMQLEDIVLETDSPYLTPVPFRGKRNESGYIRYVCEKLADIKGISVEEAAEQTSRNAERIFGL